MGLIRCFPKYGVLSHLFIFPFIIILIIIFVIILLFLFGFFFFLFPSVPFYLLFSSAKRKFKITVVPIKMKLEIEPCYWLDVTFPTGDADWSSVTSSPYPPSLPRGRACSSLLAR